MTSMKFHFLEIESQFELESTLNIRVPNRYQLEVIIKSLTFGSHTQCTAYKNIV